MEKIKTLDKTLNLRAFALATLVPIGMMIVAMWMKPLWRDELFSLYYADPNESLGRLMTERWSIDAHPPFYNPFLWAWSLISEHPFWLKYLSLVFAVLGGLLSFRLVRPDQKRHLLVFLLSCLGSYWVIYFATEIRPYVLNFTLSALLTLTGLRLYQDARPDGRLWLAWLVIGTALSLTHFFGALWFACLGFVIGMTALFEKRQKAFVSIGLLTAIGLIPVLFWIQFALGHMEFSGVATDATVLEKLRGGLHQFLRGLVVKTFGSNPLITLLGFGGLAAAILGQRKAHTVLLRAVGLTILFAFILHVAFVDMIKERAFIVVMPAILWIMAGHLSETQNPLARFVPWVTVIMPFLFISEYFKDKERFPELMAELNRYEFCQTTDLYVYYRADQPRDFHEFAAQYVLNPEGKRRLVDIETSAPVDNGKCPYIAAMILQSKNDTQTIDYVTDKLIENGQNGTAELRGKGRTVLWTDPAKILYRPAITIREPLE